MKTATENRNGLRVIKRHGAKALLLATVMAAGSNVTSAADAPSPAELEHCLHHAGLELQVDARDVRLLSAQKFSLGSERHMIALNTEVALGKAAMNPRLYCTVERDGEISMLQSMPRIPLRPASELVAK